MFETLAARCIRSYSIPAANAYALTLPLPLTWAIFRARAYAPPLCSTTYALVARRSGLCCLLLQAVAAPGQERCRVADGIQTAAIGSNAVSISRFAAQEDVSGDEPVERRDVGAKNTPAVGVTPSA